MRAAHLALCLMVFVGCVAPNSGGARGTVISPAESGAGREWSESERKSPYAIRNLQRSPAASYHMFRVQQELPTRVHENSDLVLVVVAGGPVVALGNENIPTAPGTVVEIPRGTPYAVKSAGADGSVLYGVFTPALDAADVKQQSLTDTKNAWRWNLWVQ